MQYKSWHLLLCVCLCLRWHSDIHVYFMAPIGLVPLGVGTQLCNGLLVEINFYFIVIFMISGLYDTYCSEMLQGRENKTIKYNDHSINLARFGPYWHNNGVLGSKADILTVCVCLVLSLSFRYFSFKQNTVPQTIRFNFRWYRDFRFSCATFDFLWLFDNSQSRSSDTGEWSCDLLWICIFEIRKN